VNYEHPNNTKSFLIPGHRGKEKSEKMSRWYRGKEESFGCIFVLSSLQLLCKNIGRGLSFIKSLSFDLFLSVFRRCQQGSFLWRGYNYFSFENRNFVLHFLLHCRQLLAHLRDCRLWPASENHSSVYMPVYGCSNSVEGGLFLPLPSCLSMLGMFWWWELEFVLPVFLS